MPDKRDECGCHRECTTLPHHCERPCVWPSCLTEAEHLQLAAEAMAGVASPVTRETVPCYTSVMTQNTEPEPRDLYTQRAGVILPVDFTPDADPVTAESEADETDTAQDCIIVITFGMVGEDGEWVPSHLAGLPGGPPVALNAGYETGHAVDYLVNHGWVIVSPFTFRSKHHVSAWVRPLSTRPAPALGEGPELAWTRPAELDTGSRDLTDFREIAGAGR
jgi:hypothetical protein